MLVLPKRISLFGYGGIVKMQSDIRLQAVPKLKL